jgi:hypothetical protein
MRGVAGHIHPNVEGEDVELGVCDRQRAECAYGTGKEGGADVFHFLIRSCGFPDIARFDLPLRLGSVNE